MRHEIYRVQSARCKTLILIQTLLFAQRERPWKFTSQALWKESVKVKKLPSEVSPTIWAQWLLFSITPKRNLKVKSCLPRSPQLFEPNDFFPPYLTTNTINLLTRGFLDWFRLLAYFLASLVVNRIGALLHMVLVHLLVANGFENGSWPAPSGYIRL